MSLASFEFVSTEAAFKEERWVMNQRLKVYLDHLIALQNAHLHGRYPTAIDGGQTVTDDFLKQLRVIQVSNRSSIGIH